MCLNCNYAQVGHTIHSIYVYYSTSGLILKIITTRGEGSGERNGAQTVTKHIYFIAAVLSVGSILCSRSTAKSIVKQ